MVPFDTALNLLKAQSSTSSDGRLGQSSSGERDSFCRALFVQGVQFVAIKLWIEERSVEDKGHDLEENSGREHDGSRAHRSVQISTLFPTTPRVSCRLDLRAALSRYLGPNFIKLILSVERHRVILSWCASSAWLVPAEKGSPVAQTDHPLFLGSNTIRAR